MEQIRFDLTTKVAALQEKVVRLQEELTFEKRERKNVEASASEAQEQLIKEKERLEHQLMVATKVNILFSTYYI